MCWENCNIQKEIIQANLSRKSLQISMVGASCSVFSLIKQLCKRTFLGTGTVVMFYHLMKNAGRKRKVVIISGKKTSVSANK